jgi:hypothetical protein
MDVAHQAGELYIEPLDEGDHVLYVDERSALHLLDQETDEVALPLHVRFDLQPPKRISSAAISPHHKPNN